MLDTAYLAAALPLSYRKSETNSLADGVGFEPTGLSPQLISSQRAYDHLRIHPH